MLNNTIDTAGGRDSLELTTNGLNAPAPYDGAHSITMPSNATTCTLYSRLHNPGLPLAGALARSRFANFTLAVFLQFAQEFQLFIRSKNNLRFFLEHEQEQRAVDQHEYRFNV